MWSNKMCGFAYFSAACQLPKDGEIKDEKVNQSRYRPGVAQRVLGSSRFPDFMTTALESGKVVSLTHRPHLPPGNSPGTHFC